MYDDDDDDDDDDDARSLGLMFCFYKLLFVCAVILSVLTRCGGWWVTRDCPNQSSLMLIYYERVLTERVL